MKRLFAWCAFLFAVSDLAAGEGELLCWDQTGTVSSAFGDIWSGLGNGGIKAGMPFSATLVYDASTVSSPSSAGSYPGAILFASLSIGSAQFQFDLSKPGSNSRIDVIDAYTLTFNGAEGYFWFSNPTGPENSLTGMRLEGRMLSSDTELFPDNALAIQTLPVSVFDVAHSLSFFGVNTADGTSQELDMVVNSYSVTVVPEPGIFALCAAGGATAMLVRARRRLRKR
jgi:hypothetical protein